VDESLPSGAHGSPAKPGLSSRPAEETLAPQQPLLALAGRLGALVRAGRADEIPMDVVRVILAAGVAAYAARHARGQDNPFDASIPISPTEVLATVNDMLAAMDLEPFEVSMWRSWSDG
jgi:hypothetical protein